MKKNKEKFLLIILSISMVIIFSFNLYSFFIQRDLLTMCLLSIPSTIICIICILIIIGGKSNNDNLKKEIKVNQVNRKEHNISSDIDKSNYFMNLSHELRTPLNIILSTEQLITNLNSRNENIDKEKIDYYMDILRSNSKRLLKLINDIIDISRIEQGLYNIDLVEHEIVYFVEDLVLSMKDFIESKGIELIIDPEVEEKVIECDINDIERCIVNLVGNAV